MAESNTTLPRDLDRPECGYEEQVPEGKPFPCGKDRSLDSEWCPFHRDHISKRTAEVWQQEKNSGSKFAHDWQYPSATFEELVERFKDYTRENFERDMWAQLPPPEKMEYARPYVIKQVMGPTPYETTYLIVIKDDERICHFYMVGAFGRSVSKVLHEVKEKV